MLLRNFTIVHILRCARPVIRSHCTLFLQTTSPPSLPYLHSAQQIWCRTQSVTNPHPRTCFMMSWTTHHSKPPLHTSPLHRQTPIDPISFRPSSSWIPHRTLESARSHSSLGSRSFVPPPPSTPMNHSPGQREGESADYEARGSKSRGSQLAI